MNRSPLSGLTSYRRLARRLSRASSTLVALACLCTAGTAAAQRVRVPVISPGTTVLQNAAPIAIDDSGTILAYSTTGRPLLKRPNLPAEDIGPPGSTTFFRPYAMNNRGVVIGNFVDKPSSLSPQESGFWTRETGVQHLAFNDALAVDVDDKGNVLFVGRDSGFVYNLFDGATTKLPYLAFAVNANDVFAGLSGSGTSTRLVTWSPQRAGAPRDLGTGLGAMAGDINASEAVVVPVSTGSGNNRYWSFSFISGGAPSTVSGAIATKLNDAGIIVGGLATDTIYGPEYQGGRVWFSPSGTSPGPLLSADAVMANGTRVMSLVDINEGGTAIGWVRNGSATDVVSLQVSIQ